VNKTTTTNRVTIAATITTTICSKTLIVAMTTLVIGIILVGVAAQE
jgi:hypothetical protein